MTLILKGYAELKKDLEKAIAVELKKYRIETVEQLTDSDRRNQIIFLQYIIGILDKRNLPPAESTNILYGAMSLISTTIDNSLGLPIIGNSIPILSQESLFRNGLNVAMGIDVNQPSNSQLKQFYSSLNQFLLLLFNNNDSRNGYNPTNELQFVPLDHLMNFVKTSYELEEAAQNNAIADYQIVDTPVKASYEAPVKSNNSAAKKTSNSTSTQAQIQAPQLLQHFNWEDLLRALNQLEISELANQNKADIKSLPAERAKQFLFLKKLSEKLNTLSPHLNESTRKSSLIGAMWVVREQIGQKEYSKTPLNKEDVNSLTHSTLTTILEAKTSSPQDIEFVLRSIHHFLLAVTAAEPEKFKSTHLFSDIDNFSLPNVLELIQKTIKTCRINALEKAIDDYKATQKNAKKADNSGIMNTLSQRLWGVKIEKAKESAPQAEVVNGGPK